jgi:uncharacterized membrane protein YoaK (UPF0700 family)
VFVDPASDKPAPGRRAHHLVWLVFVLTAVTGLVDAVSFVGIGHVFVANMTGNTVFVAFALAGDTTLSVASSLTAFGSFAVGALLGSRVGLLSQGHRGRMLATGIMLDAAFVTGALVVASVAARPLHGAPRYACIVLLAVGMGVQVATVRRVSVADTPSTVLTMTLTAFVADSHLAGGTGPRSLRRGFYILTLFGGALVGGLLVINTDLRAALGLAVGVLLVAALVAGGLVRRTHSHEWDGAAR